MDPHRRPNLKFQKISDGKTSQTQVLKRTRIVSHRRRTDMPLQGFPATNFKGKSAKSKFLCHASCVERYSSLIGQIVPLFYIATD
jgi:hypothetical protein